MGKRGVWHYRFRVKREIGYDFEVKEFRRSSGKLKESEARVIAWNDYLSELGLRPNGPPVRRLRNLFSKIGDICDCYEANITETSNIKSSSAHRNVLALIRIIKQAYPRVDARAMKVDVLNENLVIKYRKAQYKQLGLDYGKNEDRSLNISLNSNLRMAQSVFGRRAMKLYSKNNFKLPDLSSFMSIARLRERSMHFDPIPQKIDAKMRKDSLEELLPNRPVIFIIYELARFCGLRSSEILNLRWHWIEKSKEGYTIEIVYRNPRTDKSRIQFIPKSRDRSVSITKETIMRWIEALKLKVDIIGTSTDFVIPGATHTERRNQIEREACAWVAKYLPNRIKRLHELRKQAGSNIATQYGLMSAAEFLGDSIAVTEKHYVALLKRINPIEFSDI